MAQPTPITPILLGIPEAAALLGVSRWTITRLLDSGTLPAVTIVATRKVLRADIESLIDQQRSASIAAAKTARQRREEVCRAPTSTRGRGRPRKPVVAHQ